MKEKVYRGIIICKTEERKRKEKFHRRRDFFEKNIDFNIGKWNEDFKNKTFDDDAFLEKLSCVFTKYRKLFKPIEWPVPAYMAYNGPYGESLEDENHNMIWFKGYLKKQTCFEKIESEFQNLFSFRFESKIREYNVGLCGSYFQAFIELLAIEAVGGNVKREAGHIWKFYRKWRETGAF